MLIMQTKKSNGFTIALIIIMLLTLSVLVMSTFPIMTKLKKKDNDINPSVKACIASELASNLSSPSCSRSITNTVNDMSNTYSTILYYIEKGSSAESTAAKQVLKESCKQGSEAACSYFINKCLYNSSDCNDSTDTDIHHFLTLTYSDPVTDKVIDMISKYYNQGNTNIQNEIFNSCTENTNSASCEFIYNTCLFNDNTNSCNYFINRCKDNSACDIPNTLYDLRSILLSISAVYQNAQRIISYLQPHYDNSANTALINEINSDCLSKAGSISCGVVSTEEKDCRDNNNDAACSSLAAKCVAGDLRECNYVVSACDSGKTNACKYGYLNDINKSCSQIKTRTGGYYVATSSHNITSDSSGTYKNYSCNGDWTRVAAESYSTLPVLATWNINQTELNNKIKWQYLIGDGSTGLKSTTGYYLLGGPDIFISPDMYLEKSFDYFGIPHSQIWYYFNFFLCGPWNGEKFTIKHNGSLIYTSSAFTVPQTAADTPSKYKTINEGYDCSYGANVSAYANDSNSPGTVRYETNLPIGFTDKSFGLYSLTVYVK